VSTADTCFSGRKVLNNPLLPALLTPWRTRRRSYWTPQNDFSRCVRIESPAGQDVVAPFAERPLNSYNEICNGKQPDKFCYTEECHNGIWLQFGPVGGWCAMTPRTIYEQIRFPLVSDRTYFYEDGIYAINLLERGYRSAILKGVRCYHATGVWWNSQYQEYWASRNRDQPDELRKMKLFVERGILVKDAQRP
jgi:hypothetical protein